MNFNFWLCIAFLSQILIAQEAPPIKEQPAVDFLECTADIGVDTSKKEVKGKVNYTFMMTKKTDSLFIDAQNMNIKNVRVNAKQVVFAYNDKQIAIPSTFALNKKHTLSIIYGAKPIKALYFVKDYEGSDQVWTQGQGKYTSNWLPSFDDMNEKVIFDLSITAKKKYAVIANGNLLKKETVNDSLMSWHYDMQKPMSSYLVAFVVGNYQKITQTSESDISLEFYHYPKDSSKVKSTYKHSKEIFDFLEKEIGYPYPWQNYKQIPVKDFLYAGMENTGTTIFSDAFVIDEKSYIDKNYINVNAHELAHQWFGDLVTETEGAHHWLQEGFATYYALLAEKKIFGDDYYQYKLYESAEQLTELSKTVMATSLLDPKASSLTFYQRGAWALVALRDLIGDANFKITIHNFLERFKFRNVTTDDFLAIATEVSSKDLSVYKQTWLVNKKFPSQEALDVLSKSSFIKKYLGLAKERTQPLAGKWGTLAKALAFPVNDYIGQEVIYQLEGKTGPETLALYDKAFETNNVFIRQSIANSLTSIPVDLQKQYESLLKDPSYATIEPALYHLWSNFPENRKVYLDQTDAVIGFNDKNVRILWLVLALNTQGYRKENQKEYYHELAGYTSSSYSFRTRQNAFRYLESLNVFTQNSLSDLIDGAIHHNWRFKKFCRNMLDKLLKDEDYKKKYVDLLPNLSKNKKEFLAKKITP